MDTRTVGRWAFIIGLALAGLLPVLNIDLPVWVLPVLGLIVGFLNISGSESQGFLIAAIALAASAAAVVSLPVVGSGPIPTPNSVASDPCALGQDLME